MATVDYYADNLQLEEHTSGALRTFITSLIGNQRVQRIAGTLANLVDDFVFSHIARGQTKANPRGTSVAHNFFRTKSLVRDNLIVGKLGVSCTITVPTGNFTVSEAELVPLLSDIVQVLTGDSTKRASSTFAANVIVSRI